MNEKRYDNAWEPFSDSPEEAMANQLKADLILAIRSYIVANGWSQKDAALQLNISQPRVSYIVNGVISKFSIDKLYEILLRCGYRISVNSDSGKLKAGIVKYNHAA